MSSSRRASGASRRASAPTRFVRVWRGLPQERRLAALASAGLFFSLFLPWYQESVFANGITSLRQASSSLTGWAAFSFVEAAVLLVAAAVLILLFVRAEGQAFHVPGGDGGVITAAGLWTCVLIIWRIFDKEGTSRHDQIAYTSGIEWGIFVALGVAGVLTYAGSQIRRAHEPEPPLPGEADSSRAGGRRRWLGKAAPDTRRRATTRRAYPGPDMGAEDEWTQEFRAQRTAPPAPRDPAEAPTVRRRSEAATVRQRSEAPTVRQRSEAPATPEVPEPTTRRLRPRSISDGASPADPAGPAAEAGRAAARRGRLLDRREIQELDIAEPPTARLGRSASPLPSPLPGTDDGSDGPPDPSDEQLTIRLDRPD
ncbi:MAG TPA: hypothetical protein VMF14_04465 [Solirubrobacteraceae bacterium]|nr:hypothetical protein [Solirubrobacteraceae bacterium]